MRAQTLVVMTLCACADPPAPVSEAHREALQVSAPVTLADALQPYSTTSSKRGLTLTTDRFSGTSLAAWVDDRSGFPELMGQRVVGSQVSTTGGRLLSNPAEPVGVGAVSWSGGQYLAVWTETQTQTLHGRRVASTLVVEPDELIANDVADAIAIASLPSSNANLSRASLVVWVVADGGTSLASARVDTTGRFEPPQKLRLRSEGVVSQVAVSGDDDFYVAWVEMPPDAGSPRVAGCWVDRTTGVPRGTPTSFAVLPGRAAQEPTVAVRGTEALVGWTWLINALQVRVTAWAFDSSPAATLSGPFGHDPTLEATDSGFLLASISDLGSLDVATLGPLGQFDGGLPVVAPQSAFTLGPVALTVDNAGYQLALLRHPVDRTTGIDEAYWLGGGTGGATLLSTSTARRTRPVISISGREAVMVWNEEQWPELRLVAQTSRDFVARPSQPLTLPNERPGPADIARGRGGTFAVTYATRAMPGPYQDVWLVTLQGAQVNKVRVTTSPRMTSAPAVAVTDDDNFIVVFGETSSLAEALVYADGGSGALASIPLQSNSPTEVDVAFSAQRAMTVWSDGVHVYGKGLPVSAGLDEPGALTNTQPVVVPSVTEPGGFDVAFIATSASGATSLVRRAIGADNLITHGQVVSLPDARSPSMAPGGLVALHQGPGMGAVVLVEPSGAVTPLAEGDAPSVDVAADGRGGVLFQQLDRRVTHHNFVVMVSLIDVNALPDGGIDGGPTRPPPRDGGADAGLTDDAGSAFDGGADGGGGGDGGTGPIRFDTCGCSADGAAMGALALGLLALTRRRRTAIGPTARLRASSARRSAARTQSSALH